MSGHTIDITSGHDNSSVAELVKDNCCYERDKARVFLNCVEASSRHFKKTCNLFWVIPRSLYRGATRLETTMVRMRQSIPLFQASFYISLKVSDLDLSDFLRNGRAPILITQSQSLLLSRLQRQQDIHYSCRVP